MRAVLGRLISGGLGVVLVAVVLLSSSTADAWTIVYGDAGPSNFSSADAVAVGDDGSIYVLGTFFGEFAANTAVDGFDLFLMKLDPEGSVVWTKTWDPDSMDGVDYSLYLSWIRSADRGEVFVDGAGNIGFTMAEFIGFVDPDGVVIAVSDGADLGGLGQYFLARPQPDSDGGAILGTSDANRIVAVSSSLEIEWVSAHNGYNGQLMPLDDGGAISVYDKDPEFSFQPVAQTVTRISSGGEETWSTLHYGRCSGVGPPSAGDNTLEVVVLPGTSVVTVTSREVGGSECVAGIEMMSSYSLDTGALVDDVSVPPPTLYACSTSSTGSVIEFAASASDCTDAGWSWAINDLIPTVADLEQDVFFSVVSLTITDGAGVNESALGIARVAKASTELVVESVTRIGIAEGVLVQDIAVAPGGEPVLVGRAVDGTAALPQDAPGGLVAGADPVTAPQAFVLFDPDVVAPPPPPVDSFADDDGSIFEADIEWLADQGITKGCNPPDNTLYCPDASVTRGQMAAFLHRALDATLTPSSVPTDFADDDGSTFETDIEWLSATGITAGCNPPSNDEFCPDSPVTRGQMAAFLVRALGYTDDGGGNLFTDDNESIFETQIDKLATAGVTRGCNPPANDNFCPNSSVTRAQMAAFLHRALGI